ncbi:hypothetical protein M5D96_006702 [Drosophila gunungcola]|uniref:MADF domain-containing protein n=1 Tax=Drosophila gunungcola TaxID=103775 RepID=A0A9Q0BR58_9MUSC|nr:hypothetical protein M5D96_006702 [Drosophila gunungcola]
MPKEDPFVNRAQLLKAIKKYPEIWDSNNKLHMCRSVTSPMWTEIAEQFGGHVPTVKLQSIWSQMKYHYHNLVHRQILHKDRFNTKWEHFEPMSFMYNITVAKIVGAQSSGGGCGASPDDPPTASEMPAATPTAPQLPHLIAQPTHGQGHGMTYTAFTGLVPPPAAVTLETVATPPRKLGRPSSLHNSMRGRIIDAIKTRPSLWAGRQRTLMQTRWSIIKQRYVDELQKERHAQYSNQGFRSTWEHFERMSFMREILLKKVDEREQTREQIQEIVSEQQHHQQPQHHPSQHLHHYRPPPPPSGLVEHAQDMPIGLVQHHHEGHQPPLAMHHPHPHNPQAIRRRVKHESDLEWDPFEMILHVHGAGEPAAN